MGNTIDFTAKLPGRTTVRYKPAFLDIQIALITTEGAEVEDSQYHPHDLTNMRVEFSKDGKLCFTAENLEFGYVEQPIECAGIALKANGAIFYTQSFGRPTRIQGELLMLRLTMFKIPML